MRLGAVSQRFAYILLRLDAPRYVRMARVLGSLLVPVLLGSKPHSFTKF